LQCTDRCRQAAFGDSRSLSEITPDQIRRFADAVRIPASPLWKITVETVERTAESWNSLEQADALPKDLRDSIARQILGVAAARRLVKDLADTSMRPKL